MGSIHRMNYTAIGDNVNIAARLEGVNKHYGTTIIVSKPVFDTLPKGKFCMRKISKVTVSGKATSTAIYEIKANFLSKTPQLFHYYESSLKAFKTRDFFTALDLINKALDNDTNDGASKRLKNRIEEAIVTPPPNDWSYVEALLKI